MSKYSPLADFLKECPHHEVTLTFAKIESILGADLPPSAYAGKDFWRNNTNSHSRPSGPGWVSAGWEVVVESVDGGSVTFVKIDD